MRVVNPVPEYWREVPSIEPKHMRSWVHKLIPISVSRSLIQCKDGSEWIHLSMARPDRLPSWEEVSKVKLAFIGPFLESYHVVPKVAEHVNVHSFCMHLWTPIDGQSRVAPDSVGEEIAL